MQSGRYLKFSTQSITVVATGTGKMALYTSPMLLPPAASLIAFTTRRVALPVLSFRSDRVKDERGETKWIWG